MDVSEIRKKVVAVLAGVAGIDENDEAKLAEITDETTLDKDGIGFDSLDQVDAARALFYPSFDIKMFFGLDSIHIDDLFKGTSRQINFIPGLRLPLWAGPSVAG